MNVAIFASAHSWMTANAKTKCNFSLLNNWDSNEYWICTMGLKIQNVAKKLYTIIKVQGTYLEW